MGIRPGFAAARGGTANSGEPYHAQQREENEGKQARRVRYPHVKLWPAVGDDERRHRGGIGVAQGWLTFLFRSDSRAHRVEAGSCGLGEPRGLWAELLLQLAVVEGL